MRLDIGFGTRPQVLEIPEGNLMGVLLPGGLPSGPLGVDALKNALENPIGSGRLADLVRPEERVVIVTSDVTRPVPSAKILPVLLDELRRNKIKMTDVTVVFALGSHRGHTEDERVRLAGESVFECVRCIDSDPGDCVNMGRTASGTPVDITRVVAGADRRICVGNIEYHYFAGYSGGAKAIMPGVSNRSAIQANHSRMVHPRARTGLLEGNPVREDLEEAIRHCPIDFIVNVILDDKKEIVHAVAGDYIKAHRAGCRFLDGLYRKDIGSRADIVIASQGGAPKDLNLYQTQKALDNAKHAVRDGGIIILVGACQEGFGESTFERWMGEADSPRSLIERIQRDFQLGGHKAASIALVLEKAEISLVSEMPARSVEKTFMRPFGNVQNALEAAFEKLGKDASVLIMPSAGSVLPVADERESEGKREGAIIQ
ncbi:MAG: nickel-dependent lactate racemase [Synergistaceae bacterium]|nr:nickel-dependent lactate racemase [Synergistaceae bacterium]